MSDEHPDISEISRQILFDGLDNEVSLDLQKALITEHHATLMPQIQALMDKSEDKLFEILGRELLHKQQGYRQQENVAAGSLRKLIGNQSDTAAVSFFDDEHVGTIYKTIASGATELPEEITPQQIYRAAVILASVIAPHFTKEFKEDSRVKNLFLSVDLSLDFDFQKEEVSNALNIVRGLKLAKQLRTVADYVPESLVTIKPYLAGMALMCNAAANQVLTEFKIGMEARKLRPTAGPDCVP